jgi:hypothetical protein
MFVEQLWGINLTIQTLLEFQYNVSISTIGWSIVLRQLHVKRVVFWLGTLTKGQSEINLSRCPSMSCSQQESSAYCGPSHQRTVRNPFIVLQVSTATPSALELVQFSIRKTLDPLCPSARNWGETCWYRGSIDKFKGSLVLEAGNFLVHREPKVFGMRSIQ